ncbi:MAG TPA: tetratricopeptide repeat protein [Polyangia bacterium]|nr:tetratricopeptide repeat protein [Polyangia bacterium]
MAYGQLKSTKLCADGRYDDALTAVIGELASDPDEPEAWFNRGQALAGLDRFAEAAAAYEHALDMDASASAVDPEAIDDELFFVLRRQAENLAADREAAFEVLRRYLVVLPEGRHVDDVPKWIDKLSGKEKLWVREQA